MIVEKERKSGGETRMRRGREVSEHLTGRRTQGMGLPLLAIISHFPSDRNRHVSQEASAYTPGYACLPWKALCDMVTIP